MPEIALPEKPSTEIRGSGWFGLGVDRQDASHDRRLRELHYLGVEVAYAEAMAVAVEVKGIKSVSGSMRQAENSVYGLPPDTVAGMVAADLASDMAARSRLRHGRLMESYDAEAMNIIHHR